MMNTAEGSVLVEAPVSEIYRQLLRLEELPKFGAAVEEVRRLDANRFLITAFEDGGQRQSILEIILRVPLRRLAWRILSADSSDQLASGVVRFTPHSDRSTCITLKISSAFAGAISSQIDEHLHNFRQRIEQQIRNERWTDLAKSKPGAESLSVGSRRAGV